MLRLLFIIGLILACLSLYRTASAHDGPYQEWCEETDNGVICQPSSNWYGKWELCFEEADGTTGCTDAHYTTAEPYEPYCEWEVGQQLDGNIAAHAKKGRRITSFDASCSDDPVAEGWPHDPADPCIHPRNWWNPINECWQEIRDYLDKWDQAGTVDPAPEPTPEPTPDPDPVPSPDPEPTPSPDPEPAAVEISWVGNGANFITPNSVGIEFNLSPAATAQTDYGITPEKDETWLTHGPELNYLDYHKQSITGLTPGTTYYYIVSGQDAEGNAYQSEVRSFTTTN